MTSGHKRLQVRIQGAVQGVGFRPFVYRLARELGLSGTVANDAQGVLLEVEGDAAAVEAFQQRLPQEKPVAAVIEDRQDTWLEACGGSGFVIVPSNEAGRPTVQILPDLATCVPCLQEIRNPADRRHGYAFTNCTDCGPRFTIIRSLPYDRPRTTMSGFAMCPACAGEYADAGNRRFHAQPNACPQCGPQVHMRAAAGGATVSGGEAVQAAAAALAEGRILAVKGLGGFHLMVNATDGEAVRRLRRGKLRREKPLAVMVRDVRQAHTLCHLDASMESALQAPEAPIVLAPRRAQATLSEAVAPGNPCLGIMLPANPLHHLLMDQVSFPVVATSGNLSEEPICIDENEAGVRLAGIADQALVHDRPIARHADDSIVRTFQGQTRVLRRARGLAPRPVLLPEAVPPILAVGPHLKNTVAVSVGRRVILSQHLGDMEAAETVAVFRRAIADLLQLYEVVPQAIAHDEHPDYAATRWAQEMAAPQGEAGETSVLSVLSGVPLIPVQHHHAHLAACLAEHAHPGSALGITWDGTGLGRDGTIWGGEFLQGDAASFRRRACLRPFPLPGGDAAAREPRRCALALLWEMFGEAALQRDDLLPVQDLDGAARQVLGRMLARRLNTPRTSSAGRLFDGVAALLGLHLQTSYEGQAAMALEFLADREVEDAYPLPLVKALQATQAEKAESGAAAPAVLDWREMVQAILEDGRRGVSPARIAGRFHNALAAGMVAVAREVGEETVALSGGCFQNMLLVERAVDGLQAAGFRVLLHRQVPPNDGGISLGQVAVAAARLQQGKRGDA